MTESTVVSKGPCDKCGSSDGNVLYDDGHSYCFVCEAYTHGDSTMAPTETVTLTSVHELGRLTQAWQQAKPVALPDRSITSATASKYKVAVVGEHHYYPYFSAESTDPVGFKVRHVKTKAFRSVGDIKSGGLFGQQRYGNHKQNRVVVVEGELDALAASALFDDKVAVVSLKGGAAAAAKDFKNAYNFLDGFTEIVVCFDADEAGLAAVEKAAEVFAGNHKRPSLWMGRAA